MESGPQWCDLRSSGFVTCYDMFSIVVKFKIIYIIIDKQLSNQHVSSNRNHKRMGQKK